MCSNLYVLCALYGFKKLCVLTFMPFYAFYGLKTLCSNLYALYALYGSKNLYALTYMSYMPYMV